MRESRKPSRPCLDWPSHEVLLEARRLRGRTLRRWVAEAISHLEVLRSMGGDFLLLPNTALWWLDYYKEFSQHLENNYHKAVCQEDVCVISAPHR